MAVISVENLTHTYSVGTPFEQTAIRDVSVTLTQGESIFVLGHTGSGKSTFVQHLNALLQPTRGTVKIDGEDINKDKISRRDVKRRVGLVFQYPEYQLFEETVAEDIAFGPKNMKLSKEEIDERVREAAGFVGVILIAMLRLSAHAVGLAMVALCVQFTRNVNLIVAF